MKYLVGLLLAFGVIWAQDVPSSRIPAPAQPQKDTERRLGLLVTRATANFRSADSIEANLNALGHSLHPQIVALRLRIEAALDEAQKAIDHADLAAANEALDKAQALLQRFIQRLGEPEPTRLGIRPWPLNRFDSAKSAARRSHRCQTFASSAVRACGRRRLKR